MKVFKFCIAFLWVFQKFASRFMEVIKKSSPLYERFKNVHYRFLKVFKFCISFLWVFQKFASRFMKVVKNCISFVWARQPCASRFYGGLENMNLLFMSLSKICSTVNEGLNSFESPLMSASNNFASQYMAVPTICKNKKENTKVAHPCYLATAPMQPAQPPTGLPPLLWNFPLSVRKRIFLVAILYS